MNDLVVYKIAD